MAREEEQVKDYFDVGFGSGEWRRWLEMSLYGCCFGAMGWMKGEEREEAYWAVMREAARRRHRRLFADLELLEKCSDRVDSRKPNIGLSMIAEEFHWYGGDSFAMDTERSVAVYLVGGNEFEIRAKVEEGYEMQYLPISAKGLRALEDFYVDHRREDRWSRLI